MGEVVECPNDPGIINSDYESDASSYLSKSSDEEDEDSPFIPNLSVTGIQIPPKLDPYNNLQRNQLQRNIRLQTIPPPQHQTPPDDAVPENHTRDVGHPSSELK